MLVEKNECTGCGACFTKCPRGAIEMSADSEGFIYPRINAGKCNGCLICEKACPVLNLEKMQLAHHNQECHAAFLQDEEMLCKVSSGGAATALAQTVIRSGGSVFGVSYTKDFKSAEFILCTAESDLAKIRGTKYIQSRKNDIYREIEKCCKQGELTLVIGLPCEIAAVKSFLGKEYEKLYTCELICHGPTSEKVQKHFIQMLERKYRSVVTEYNVRYKKRGWTPLYVQAKFANGKKYERRLDRTDFFHALAIFIRPSCYRCGFKGDRRVADISIGDFWGDIEKEKFYHKNGVSAIMIHTEKGISLFQMVKEMAVYPVSYEMIQNSNPRIDTSETEVKKRKRFSKIFVNGKLSTACILSRGVRKSLRNIFWRFEE